MKKSYIVFSFFLLITVFGSLAFSTSKVEASRWGAPAYPNYSSNYSNMGYGYGNSYSRWGDNGYYFPSYYPENNYGYGYNNYNGYNNNYYNNYSSYNPYSYYNDYGYDGYGYNYNNNYYDSYYGGNNWYNDGYNYGGSGFGFGIGLCLFGC